MMDGFVRHPGLIDKWVVIDGVRTSYRGILRGVDEVAEGALYAMDPCFALKSLSDTEGEVRLPTEDEPFYVYSAGCLGIGCQPKGWSTTY